ncbi:hypothetical protein G9A89_018166 [Geosiphon pyriformis]|nr:hypothetical protein G9A89_018166 [Geosiphon pyriformis]
MCNVHGLNNPVKQDDVIHWHKDIDNLLANKFDGIQVFAFGLDSGSLGAGVLIVVNSSLAKHVCKISEVSGQLLSIKLLFKNKLLVSILGLYAGASSVAWFFQTDEINFLIAKAINEFFFVILGGNFNENGSHKCASFKKCFDLGLINSLKGSSFVKSSTWCNSCGITKTIEYVFVSSNLAGVVVDRGVDGIEEYFDTNHKAVYVSMGLDGLLNFQLNSLYKQANKDCWKYDIKDASKIKWSEFRNATAANVVMFSDEYVDIVHKVMVLSAGETFKKKWFKGFNCVFNKLLVSKLVKASWLVFGGDFALLLDTWNRLNSVDALSVKALFLSGAGFDAIQSKHARKFCIRQTIKRRIESFEVDKSYTIRSVLEHSFHKMVLDHLVDDGELVLEPDLVKSKVDVIMEGWTRKHGLVTDISADWCYQYQPLEYVFDNVFSRIMDPISSVKLFGVVSDLPNDKAASLSVPGSWKEAWMSIISKPYEWEGILSKIFLDRISLACSTHNVFRGDNFLVLKGTTTQSPIFAVSLVVENALEKNRKLWLVLQNMKKAYNSVGWEHLKKSLIRIKMCGRFIQFFGGIHSNRVNRVMTDFGLTDGYQVHDGLDQEEVFSLFLWHIFYDSLLCKVKRQEKFYWFFSFFAAGVFVDNTIWVSSSQTATQHIFNVASEFFRINDISINNNKTVAIPINCKIVSPFLTISSVPISIAKKGEPYRYLGIFLFTGSLSKPSLTKVHLDVQFFTNFILKKAISNKQFSYLVSAVFHSIVSYRTQFSFVLLSVCCKWDALICKGFKSKAGLPSDFSNDAFHYFFLYGLKTFEQIQAESKSVFVMCFANATLSWHLVHPLVFPACLKLNPSNNFLADVMKFSKCFSSLWRYGIAFVEQLRHCNGGAFDWKTFKHWKRLDPRGSIPNWFNVSVGYLGSAESSSSVHNCLVGVSFAPNVLESTDFDLVCNCLLGLDANSLSVYTNESLAGLSTLSVKLGVVVFFDDINMSLSIRVLDLLSSTLAELQAIALALECILAAVLDACRSELGLVHLDFWNSCWVECHHIVNLVCAQINISNIQEKRPKTSMVTTPDATTLEYYQSIYTHCKQRFNIPDGIEVVKKSVYQYIENHINNYLFGNYNISEVRSNFYNNLVYYSQLGTEDLNKLNFNIIKYCEETYLVQSQYSIDFKSETETSNKGKQKLKQYSKTTPNTPILPKTTAKYLQTPEQGTSSKLLLTITPFPASLAQAQTPNLPLNQFARLKDFTSSKSPIRQQEPLQTTTNEENNSEISEEESINSENEEDEMTAYIAKISEFNGEDIKTSPQKWLNQVTKAGDANGWNAARMLKTIPYFLKETAGEWFENLTTSFNDWTAFKTAFLE